MLEILLAGAKENPRLRQNFDLRTSFADTSQRMLNALQPQTEVPIHRHEKTAETVICLVGKLEEIIYEEVSEYVHESTSCCDDVVRQKVLKKFHVKYYLQQKVDLVFKYPQEHGIR